MPDAQTCRLLRLATVAQRLDVHPSTVLRMIERDPDFPAPCRIGPNRFWAADEIDGYIKRRLAVRDRKSAPADQPAAA